MKILYFDFFSSASEFYRLLPLDYLQSPNFAITRSTEKQITFATINPYDVIIFLRPSSEAHLNAIKLCKDQHKYVIADHDDDVLHLDEHNPMYGIYESDKQHAIKCLTLSDEIWAATDAIKQAYRLYNKNIHVIPNAHNDYIFHIKNKKKFDYNKMCMWRGGGSHEGDIYENGVTETIIGLINGNETWNFYWLGMRFKFIEIRVTKGNFYRNDGASTIQFYKMMHEFNPCVFIYPLSTNVFNRGKSLCSWIEATYSGAAVFGNKNLPEFNKDSIGVFSGDVLKTSKSSLKRMNENSWKYILKNLLLSDVNKKRLDRLEKISYI